MAVDAARAKTLFLAASDLSDPAERTAYLERECGGDAELRQRVEALLAAHDGAEPLLEKAAATASVRTDLTGETLEATAASSVRKRVCRRSWRPRKTRSDGRETSRSPKRAPRADRPGGSGVRPGHRRTVHAARSPRRGGNGHRLPGRSDFLNRSSGRWRAKLIKVGMDSRAVLAAGSTPSGRRWP